MEEHRSTEIAQDHAAIAESLLQVAVNLSAVQDRRQLLDMILREARKLTQAEAGSLFILDNGRLTFAASQNDCISLPDVTDSLLTHELTVPDESLAGFVASTGRVMNIPNAYALSSGAPFRIDRRFDAATGYKTRSVLAIPLLCPDDQCVGVLELINRVGANGKVVPFLDAEGSGVMSLASMAAVTIQNAFLQEQLKKAHLDSIIRLSIAAELRDDVGRPAEGRHNDRVYVLRRAVRTIRLDAAPDGGAIILVVDQAPAFLADDGADGLELDADRIVDRAFREDPPNRIVQKLDLDEKRAEHRLDPRASAELVDQKRLTVITMGLDPDDVVVAEAEKRVWTCVEEDEHQAARS